MWESCTRKFRRSLCFAALVLIALAFGQNVARAQIAVLVNGDPITSYDIEQRSRFLQVTTHKAASRQQAIEELIGDRLKLQTAKRYGLEVSDADVEGQFASMARGARLTPDQFAKSLGSSGLDVTIFKAKIRADIAWIQIVRGKFRSSLEVAEKDILTKLEGDKNDKDKEVGYEYVLRPILFVVPRGSPDGAAEARKREAEALRNRFQDCNEGIRLARGLRDVAVREVVRRNSGELSPQLRAILDSVQIGRLTAPEVTQAGVEVFALCEKNETTIDTAGKRKARDEIFEQRFQQQAARYLKELRKGAMIEYK